MSTVEKGKHTAGPWHQNIRPASKYPVIFAGRNKHVARVITDGLSEDEQEANCRLIAAAPELLGALKAVLEHASLDPNHLHKFSPDYQRAQAAIAKAEGKG